jgi:hypothetical protein
LVGIKFHNKEKLEKLIADEDIRKIVNDFRLKEKFQQKMKNELNNQFSPTNLTQSLRTEIDKTINTKIEFIQMLLAAKNNDNS